MRQVALPTVGVLSQLNTPGPRYTSYPSAQEFTDAVDGGTYAEHLKLAHEADSQAPLSLYVHLPFCEKRCLFCGCHAIITSQRDVAERYLRYLHREIAHVSGHVGTHRGVEQLHWGGGTPTYFEPDQLESLFGGISAHFQILDHAEISVEIDPRVTQREHLTRLGGLGFNRLSLGIQDFTPRVQEAIGRHQTFEETRNLIEHARAVGFASGINVDLIYGLPGQTLVEFRKNLRAVLLLRPDRVALYSFAFIPQVKGHQRRIDASLLPDARSKLELYLAGMEEFSNAGYEAIGMDHFALPDDELARAARCGKLHRNFMGYTTRPSGDLIAFGVSGISEVAHGFFQNEYKLSRYYRNIDDARLPTARGYVRTLDDRIRACVIGELMCNFTIDKEAVRQEFGIPFDDYFDEELARLECFQLLEYVEATPDRLTVTPSGRFFVRNVCMEFDPYVRGRQLDKPFATTV